jgi:hypothetical protein
MPAPLKLLDGSSTRSTSSLQCFRGESQRFTCRMVKMQEERKAPRDFSQAVVRRRSSLPRTILPAMMRVVNLGTTRAGIAL